jgi:hypothetical protein
LDDACAALAAAETTGRPVTLQSGPDMAHAAGVRYFKEMRAILKDEFPDQAFGFRIDCADDPGLVLAALRIGLLDILFSGRPGVAAKLAAIATKKGGHLHRKSAGRTHPALDLLDRRDPFDACREWLKSVDRRPHGRHPSGSD